VDGVGLRVHGHLRTLLPDRDGSQYLASGQPAGAHGDLESYPQVPELADGIDEEQCSDRRKPPPNRSSPTVRPYITASFLTLSGFGQLPPKDIMTDASSDYEQLLALHHAMQLRRSLREEGRRTAPVAARRPTGYPDREGDQALMVASLETIGSSADEVVRSFYAQLFLGRPYLRGLFPAGLRADGDRLFNALIGLAEALSDLPRLVEWLEQLGRDHRKYGIRPAHYDAVRQALVGALREHAAVGWRPEYEQAWLRAYDFAAAVMQSAEAASTDPPYWQGTIVAHHRPYLDIAVMKVRTDVAYRYRAGQYTTIEVPAVPRAWRPYSMATAPRPDGVLEFHVRAIDLGQVSTALVHDMGVGSTLRLGPPMGSAVIETTGERPLLVVAGGTGLAPCRAIVEQVLTTQPGRPVRLIFGARQTQELYNLPILAQLAERYPALTLVPVATDDPDFPGPRGALPELVASTGPWHQHEVYLSGPPGLVHALDRVLSRLQVPPAQVHHDPVPD
jgi:NAD(P)H-flavin reductase/hemoglobin-like flavoprotein